MHKFGKCCFAGIVIPRVPTSGEENWLSLSMRIESVYYKHGCFVYKFSRHAALVGVGWRDWWHVTNLNAGGVGSSVTTRLHKATYPHMFTKIFQDDLIEGGLTSVGNQKRERESPWEHTEQSGKTNHLYKLSYFPSDDDLINPSKSQQEKNLTWISFQKSFSLS